jgi:hypothetical protein
MKNKKAQEGMTIGTIIIIILALVVLVFLIFAFARGGGNLMDYISNIFGGGANVDTIKNSCSIACTANSNYAFCEEPRTLRLDSKQKFKGTCSTLVSKGIEPCATLTCIKVPEKCPTGITWKPSCDSTEEDITSTVVDSEGNDISLLKCCRAKTI